MNSLLCVALYLFAMLLIGRLANRHVQTLEDYMIAGRKLPFFLAVPTIVATWFGAGSVMGVSGTVYAQGFHGVIADPFGCALSAVIAGLFFAIPFRRSALWTISDLLAKAYGSQFERVATLLTLPFYVGTLAANLLAMGYIIQIMTGTTLEFGMLIGLTVVLFYTFAGGMWAVTVTDFLQLGLLAIGLLLIIPICLNHTPNLPLLIQTFFHEFQGLLPHGSPDGTAHWAGYLGRIFMTGLGALMGQDLIQRIMASRTEKIARSSAITAGFLYLALGFIPLFVGLAGRDILPNLEKPEQLMPLLAKAYLSPLAFTLFSCGILAAIMSTADSYLLAGTSLVVNNILLKIYPLKTEKNKLRLARWSNVCFALLAFGLALSGPSIFDLIVHSGAMLFVCIFVPTSAALFLKSTHRLAAWVSVLVGLFTWITAILAQSSDWAANFEEVLFSAALIGAIASLISYIAIFISMRKYNSLI